MNINTVPTTTWIVYDHGKIGTLNQCLGLAEALNVQAEIKPVKARYPWEYLPPSLWLFPLKGLTPATQLKPPWPDLIISAGRVSAAPCAKIKQLTQGRTRVVQLLNPRMHPSAFDAVIVPYHDGVQGRNVITTLGPLHRVTTERLQSESKKFAGTLQNLNHPRVAVLIGGSNKHFTINKDIIHDLACHLRRLSDEHNMSLMVTVSRRTPPACVDLLRQELQGLAIHFWDSKGENPYYAYLAFADFIIVTCDSISMLAEAASTGKPTYMIKLPGQSRKFQRFYNEMERLNYLKIFKGSLHSFDNQPLNDMEKVIKHLRLLQIIS